MLKKLMDDIKSIDCQFEIIFVKPKDEGLYNLSSRSPANVGADGKIYIMDRLKEEERIEAIAHELGHIFFRHKGQVCLENFEDQHNFPLEINNVISHNAIIKMLANQYGIESNLHKMLRVARLTDASNYLEQLDKAYQQNAIDPIDYRYYLAAFALHLRDVEMCFPEYHNQINQIAINNPFIEKVINAALTLLFDVGSGISELKQKEMINKFIEEVGFSTQDFEYR